MEIKIANLRVVQINRPIFPSIELLFFLAIIPYENILHFEPV